jgi:hypothetical protein
MIAFWATPTMTLAHLLFAMLMTSYILVAIPLEERDLIAHFGEKYRDYRRRVGGLVPRFGMSIDLGALKDLSWWSWVLMIALLAMRLVTQRVEPIVVAAGICAVLAVLDASRRGLRAMSVQVRLGYVLLLLVGLLPGMSWIHLVQLVGTSARVVIGYCLLHRELMLMPWNSSGRQTLAAMLKTLFAVPGEGGLVRLGAKGMSAPCAGSVQFTNSGKMWNGVDPEPVYDVR